MRLAKNAGRKIEARLRVHNCHWCVARFFTVFLVFVLVSTNAISSTAQDDNPSALITAQNVSRLQQVARFGSGLQTGDPVWAPSGDYFAIASSLGIWIYDVAALDDPALVSIGDTQIDEIAFSPDGSRLAAIHNKNTGESATVYVLDVSTWTTMLTLEFPDRHILGRLTFSSDGTRLLIPGAHKFLLWDIVTELPVFSAEHDAQLTEVVFSPDESLIASADYDGVVRLWNAQTGEMDAQLDGYREGKAIWSVTFNREMTRLSARGNGGWMVWDLATGAELIAIQEREALNPDNTLALILHDDEKLSLWDVNSGTEIALLDSSLNEIRSVCWRPDGRILLAADKFGAIQAWDTLSGDSLFRGIGHTGPVFHLTWIPDTTRVLSTSVDGRIALWDASTGEQIAVHDGRIGPLGPGHLSPDGTKFIVKQWRGDSLELWDLQAQRSLSVIDSFSGNLVSLAFSRDGRWLAGSDQRQTSIWEVSSSQRAQLFDSGIMGDNYLVSAPDHLLVALTLSDGSVDIWDILDQQRVMTATPDAAGQAYPLIAAISPGNKHAASLNLDGLIQLWNIDTGQVRASLEGHDGEVRSVCFLPPDGSLLVSAGRDATIRIWNVNFGVQLAVIENQSGLGDVACSPDGTQFANAIRDREQGTVILWGSNDAQLLKTLKIDGRATNGISFNPSGNLIVIGTENGFEVWNVATGEHLASFPQDSIHVVAFSPDGTILATGGRDGTIRLWTVGGRAIE